MPREVLLPSSRAFESDEARHSPGPPPQRGSIQGVQVVLRPHHIGLDIHPVRGHQRSPNLPVRLQGHGGAGMRLSMRDVLTPFQN